jgi:hypothetical protein
MSLPEGLARLVALGLTTWLAASTVEQLRFPGVQRYRRWDVLGLIPVWTFFAPNPATGDFYVVYRDELRSGTRTIWTETAVPPGRRRLLASIWNPDRRATKALFDIASALAVTVRDSADPDAVQLTLPYLALLTFVCSQAAHAPEAVATQFMLLTDHGMNKPSDPAPVFLSHWHNL